jgi:hypothetical protein
MEKNTEFGPNCTKLQPQRGRFDGNLLKKRNQKPTSIIQRK